MNLVGSPLQEFVDAIQTSADANAFERIAARLAQKLGFQRFTYLRRTEEAPMLISS